MLNKEWEKLRKPQGNLGKVVWDEVGAFLVGLRNNQSASVTGPK